mmetsp:Transcript_26813/g.87984  ORF Transcript_26813/g.87984 Transcript_26813/m.87984 type:complete len:232 (-) Transcript_26813:730-1425(-)
MSWQGPSFSCSSLLSRAESFAFGQVEALGHGSVRVVGLDDAFGILGDVLLRLRRGEVPLHVQPVANLVVRDTVFAKLQPFRSDFVEDPRERFPDEHGRALGGCSERRFVVAHDRLHHKGSAIAARDGRRRLELAADEAEHLRPALVAHRHVLRVPVHRHVRHERDTHVPHHEVREAVDVVEARVARRRNHIFQLVRGQAKVRHLFVAPIKMFEVDLVVLRKFVVLDRVWVL